MRKWKSTLIVSPKPESNLNMAGTLQLHWVRRQVCIAKRGLTENVSKKHVRVRACVDVGRPSPSIGGTSPCSLARLVKGAFWSSTANRDGMRDWSADRYTCSLCSSRPYSPCWRKRGIKELKECVCSAGYILPSGDKMSLNVLRKTAKTWQNLDESLKY